MATKGAKYLKSRMVAKLVTENRQPCVFCQQDVDDEVIYGKLYALGDIQCHYFCVLLSCCLVQKGKDTEGLFGFLYKDILAEVERSKKHKCSYCGRGGASLGCSVSACRKQFHLPCGRQKNAISLFYGNYKSFCELHAPKQKISASVMANAKERLKREKLVKAGKIPARVEDNKQTEGTDDPAMVCVICYEEVQGYPNTQTFWPPCCGRDAWLHRSCLQRMALSAGMHYLKCPLCNDKDTFYEAVSDQGYYLPDRDAAWELEQNAFAEIYSRDVSCAADACRCPLGRSHDELGMWDIKLCLLCGSWGMHAQCLDGHHPLCSSCRPAAEDIELLQARLAAVIAEEQAREQQSARSGPLMPSRMSLRRTKRGLQAHSSSSSTQNLPIQETVPRKTETQSASPMKDRLELNLKTPRRKLTPNLKELGTKLLIPNYKELESKLLSPIKMLEQTYLEKGGGGDVVVTNEVIEKLRLKFSKPKPLSAKKKILNEILDDLFKNDFKQNMKSKDPLKEWNSPKKSFDVTATREDTKENIEHIMSTNTFVSQAPEIDENPDKDVEMVAVTNDSTVIEEPDKLDEKCEEENVLDANKNGSANEETNTGTDDKENVVHNHTGHDENVVKDDETIKRDDKSSNSFQLPQELIPKNDDTLPIFDTPKKLKTVDIKQDSSIEISEQEEKVNINVVQIGSGKEKEFIRNLSIKSPIKNKMCSFKFSPADKETLQTSNVDIDVETFKDQYLNEVGRDFKSNPNLENDAVMNTPVDLTKGRKRKSEMNEEVSKNRKKFKSKMKIKMDGDKIRTRAMLQKKKDPEAKGKKIVRKVKTKESELENSKDNTVKKLQHIIEIAEGELENEKNKRRAKKLKKISLKKKLQNKHVSVKIKLKEKKMKIKKCKKQKSYKQYILKYSPVQTNKVIAKPDVDVSPMKRKYTKQEKPPDKLVQTSIQSFFKVK